MPRLMRLKTSVLWRANNPTPGADPARRSMGSLTDEYLLELYPDSAEAVALRQQLFMGAYSRFVIARFRDNATRMCAFFKALATIRDAEEHLTHYGLPIAGAEEWIPAEITDEIRSLDSRYSIHEPGTPAAYVVDEPFWVMVVKASAQDIDSAIDRCLPQSNSQSDADDLRAICASLSEVAQTWTRSPSVVGLCYQVD